MKAPDPRLKDAREALWACANASDQIGVLAAALSEYGRSRIVRGEVIVDAAGLVEQLCCACEAIRALAEWSSGNADQELAQ